MNLVNIYFFIAFLLFSFNVTICLLVIILLIWFVVYIANKFLKKLIPLISKYPVRITSLFLILIIELIYVNEDFLKYLRYKNSPYRFWYELINKNSRPYYVNFKSYAVKNKEGYCWRDHKYYSKDELWYKALKSLTGRIIYENKLYWDNETLDMNGQKDLTRHKCKSSDSCRVWSIPINLTNQELKDFIGSGAGYISKINYLTKIKQSKVYTFATDQNFIEANFTSKNFILIQLASGATIYGTDCCRLLNKSEWSLLKDNYKLFYAQTNEGTFVKEARIPANTNLNEWGVGNYYLTVNGFMPSSSYQNSFHEVHDVFIVNNCGDVLYKPYYFLDYHLI